MVTYIKKRDGKIVDFNERKIANAILLAMKEVGEEDHAGAVKIASAVSDSITDTVVEVESIQDAVEFHLMDTHPKVAKSYIKYRQERSRVRRMNADINKHVKEVLSCSNVQNSNANLDEYSFGGRKNEASNIIQKDLALNEFIAPESVDAFKNNEMYIHDLSEYTIGSHNCLHADLRKLLTAGFQARNGDVRGASTFATACQLIAVVFQIQSQVQFGGVASSSLDYELASFVRLSFLKHYKKGLRHSERRKIKTWDDFCTLYNEDTRRTASVIAKCNIFKDYSNAAYKYAHECLEEEGLQSAQALYHNLNTLESRAGAQLPFTSMNIGLDTSFEGRKVTEWCLKASIDGIGEFKQTPIFPISIFKYKKDVNDRPGTPNYDLKKLAITSLCKRIYPNWTNSDWSMNKADMLLSQYKINPDILGDATVNVRIGSRCYNGITVELLWHKIAADLHDEYKVSSSPDGIEIIDIRFINKPVCIEDMNSKYTDYAISLDECMARINYITRAYIDGEFKYGITTDTFAFNLSNYYVEYHKPKYDYDTEMATMGCRTLIGHDVNGMGYKKTGRGNVTPVTINLVKIGIDHGICLGEREEADVDGFFTQLNKILKLSEKTLLDRFNYICSQDYRSGLFMYVNGTIADADKSLENGIFESLKHCTNAIGYIGIAEACYAMYGKYHNQDQKVLEFAVSVVKAIYDYAKDATARNQLNFSAYATPAEGCCRTICQNLQKEYGKIPGVCDREYITNSHHVPVFEKISIFDKIKLESKFTKYPGGGCITYVELESSIMNNPTAVESIIDFAMANDIPYIAINFPIDNCEDCGYSGEIVDSCHVCGSTNIKRLRRVTGYLTSDFRKFNPGKIEECLDRVKHSIYTNEL